MTTIDDIKSGAAAVLHTDSDGDTAWFHLHDDGEHAIEVHEGKQACSMWLNGADEVRQLAATLNEIAAYLDGIGGVIASGPKDGAS